MRIQSSTQSLSGIGQVLGRATRTLSRCLVCGFRELRTDEVVDRGLLLLAECPRCEHRFTVPLSACDALLPTPRVPARSVPAPSGAVVAA